jgi:hypothetical protein
MHSPNSCRRQRTRIVSYRFQSAPRTAKPIVTIKVNPAVPQIHGSYSGSNWIIRGRLQEHDVRSGRSLIETPSGFASASGNLPTLLMEITNLRKSRNGGTTLKIIALGSCVCPGILKQGRSRFQFLSHFHLHLLSVSLYRLWNMACYEFSVWRGEKDGTITEDRTQRGTLTSDQVYINVTHSGVCATDLHYAQSGIALGHEGVGVVEAVGPEVKNLNM